MIAQMVIGIADEDCEDDPTKKFDSILRRLGAAVSDDVDGDVLP